MKGLKLIIAICIIVIIITAGGIGYIKYIEKKEIKDLTEKDYEGYLYIEENPEIVIDGQLPEKVNFYGIYYSVETSINSYINYIRKNNKNAVYSMLDKEYIKQNEITVDNVLDKVEKYNKDEKFIAIEIYNLNGIEYYSYYVYGRIGNSEVYYTVNYDTSSNAYSIIISNKEEYNKNIETPGKSNGGSEKKIQNLNFNTIFNIKVTDATKSEKFFELYKSELLNNTEKAYELLNQEYRTKRFGNYKNFEQYVAKNKNELKEIEIKEYSVITNDDYTEYICKDQNKNLYIYRVNESKNILDYEVLLDEYTIRDSADIKEYSSYTDEKKVSKNIYIWIQMLNNRDYDAAYDVINENFRNKNWKSKEEFENYFRNYFSSHYDIEFGEIKNQGTIYYQTITLIDLTGKNNKNMTIIMQLKDNMDFEMSFNVE